MRDVITNTYTSIFENNLCRKIHDLKKEAMVHKLQHDNIVALYAMTLEDDHYGLVMEYVLHGSLDDFVFNYDVGRSVSTSASRCVCARLCTCV